MINLEQMKIRVLSDFPNFNEAVRDRRALYVELCGVIAERNVLRDNLAAFRKLHKEFEVKNVSTSIYAAEGMTFRDVVNTLHDFRGAIKTLEDRVDQLDTADNKRGGV